MATIEIEVSSGPDDGYGFYAGYELFNNDEDTAFFGDDGSSSHGFMRFILPSDALAGATVLSAFISLWMPGASGQAQVNIYGDDENNPDAPTDWPSLSGIPYTTEFVPWTTVDQSDGTQSTPDITAIVQELVDSYPMGSGDAIQFVLDGDSYGQTNAREFATWESNNPAARLIIVTETVAPPIADILWVSNSGNPSSGDRNLIDFLRGEGHTVDTVVDTNGPPNNYEALYDFVIISSNTGGSSAPGDDYTDSILPVLLYQPYAADEMEISAAHSDRSNQTTINIVGAGHPLVAGFPNGDLVVTDSPVTFSAETTQGPGWVLLAEGSDGSVQYGYYDQLSIGNDGFEMPAKRAFFAVRSNAMTAANDNWKALLNGFIIWVLGSGSGTATITSVYDGNSFAPVATSVWDGANWVPVVTKVWDGNTWVP